MITRLLACTPIILAALSGTAFAAEDLKAHCTLTYKGAATAEGPCKILEEGSIVRVKATVNENGQTYIVIIDNSKNTGLLIGAGTFTVADGELSKNEATEVSWPNGHVLKVDLK